MTPWTKCDDGGDALAPARVRHTDDRGVVDVRVRLDGGLDLLREDLLTPGVDRDRSPPEQADRTVLLQQGQVACHHVPRSADLDEDAVAHLLVE